jgi:hypothetical protein
MIVDFVRKEKISHMVRFTVAVKRSKTEKPLKTTPSETNRLRFESCSMRFI